MAPAALGGASFLVDASQLNQLRGVIRPRFNRTPAPDTSTRVQMLSGPGLMDVPFRHCSVAPRRRLALACAFLAVGIPAMDAQVVWSVLSGNYSTPGNWVGGVAPANDGTANVSFPQSDRNNWTYVDLDTAVNVQSVSFNTSTNGIGYGVLINNFYDYSASLTIGSGGITLLGTNAVVEIDAPLILSANQTWNLGASTSYLYVEDNVSGAYGITVSGNGFLYMQGPKTFSGNVTFTGSPFVELNGSNPLGTGALTLSDNITLWADSYEGSSATLGNPTVSLGNNMTLEGSLAFLGNSSFTNNTPTVNLSNSAAIFFEGSLGTPSTGGSVSFTSGYVSLPFPTVYLQGPLTNIQSLSATNIALIFDPTPSVLIAGQLGSLTTINGSNAYVGMGAQYAGAVSTVLSLVNGPDFRGTIGLDTVTNPSSPATFTGTIDLSSFTNSGFWGLGSSTNAIIGPDATIVPPSTASGYVFGGGGGTLEVQADLGNQTGGRTLTLNPGMAPLTLVLSGRNTYAGGTSVTGGALIFNSSGSIPPTGQLQLGSNSDAPGYIGYTTNAVHSDSPTRNAQAFVSLFNTESAAYGVIGFDAPPNGSAPTISDPIDLTGLNSNSSVFLGTSTSATIAGVVTPQEATYQFSAIKGGSLTVTSVLSDQSGTTGVVIGLQNPIEFNGSISSVTLNPSPGPNTYTGTTTLNSGNLYLTSSGSVGSGAIVVPGSYSTPSLLAPADSSITLANNISVSSAGLNLGPSSGGAGSFILDGIISDVPESSGSLSIYSPVTLNGANTLSGGIDVYNTTLTIGNDSALGTGSVYLSSSMLVCDAIAPAIGGLSLYNSTVELNGSAPVITDLVDNSYDTSSTIELLGSSTALTLKTPNSTDYCSYYGTITGTAGSSVVKTGPGTQYLGGNDAYGGGTTVAAGTLVAGASAALGTGAVTVNSGAVLDLVNNSTLTNPITVQDGATLGGVGTFDPGSLVSIQNGTLLSPDGIQYLHPVATLSFGTGTPVDMGPNGGYQFDIMNATGVAGTDYDTVNVAGALSISSTPSNPFSIYVRSIDPSTGAPGVANFNPGQPYTWTLLSAGSISGFSPLDFSIDTSLFQNTTNGGQFFITDSGTDLVLNFTPVPEPSTWALMAGGLCALAAAIRLRRR